jgi:prophage maintenance system killer protein
MINDDNIRFLEIEHILDVNELIRLKSKDNNDIDYSGEESYSIDLKKLNALIENTPNEDILNIAVYYLKNIILLQPFPDANHRTALACVELFLMKNELYLEYTTDDAVLFQKNAYRVRLSTYGHYDQHTISVLAKTEDDFSILCKDFIESNLTERG